MKDRLRVAASFALIFAFSTVDSAVSPMVDVLHAYYGVPLDKVLLLISTCTTGIVLGVFVGPVLTSTLRVSRMLAAGVVGLTVAHALFLLAPGFGTASACRFFFGLSSGMIASVLWWLTFHGVSKEYNPAMIAVLMSARPLATAIGVPAVGFLAAKTCWQAPLWVSWLLILVSGAGLWSVMPEDEGEKKPADPRRMLLDYRDALTTPHAAPYYIGSMATRMCYFGFYSLSGIWFIRHYGLSLEGISLCLLVIGLAEAPVNLVIPAMLRKFGHWPVFGPSLLVSALILPVFLFGKLPLAWAVGGVALFMLLDRVYSMAAVVTIPQMFPSLKNKTIFGSMNTLAAWVGLTVISWFEGRFTERIGITAVQWILVVCFLLGAACLWRVQSRTVPKST